MEKVARGGQPMLTSDAQSDVRLNLRQSLSGRSVLERRILHSADGGATWQVHWVVDFRRA